MIMHTLVSSFYRIVAHLSWGWQLTAQIFMKDMVDEVEYGREHNDLKNLCYLEATMILLLS